MIFLMERREVGGSILFCERISNKMSQQDSDRDVNSYHVFARNLSNMVWKCPLSTLCLFLYSKKPRPHILLEQGTC